MKKITMETEYNVMKEVAKQLGVKFVGVTKVDLVEAVNAKIDESKKTRTTGKWFEQENAFPYEAGQVVIITNHKYDGIHNRMVEVAGPSTKRNAIKGYLINDKNGENQKTCISLDFEAIEVFNMETTTPIETEELIAQ